MFAASKSSNTGTDTEVTAFNGGESVYVSHSDWAGSTTYDITIDDTTAFSNGRTVGLGDIVVVAITKDFGPNPTISTSDFTLLYESAGGSGDPLRKVYYAIYNGTDLTISVTKSLSVSQRPFLYHYYSVRYPDTSTPFDVSISTETFNLTNSIGSTETLTVNPSSLTTVTDNAIVVNGLLAVTNTSSIDIVSDLSTPSNMSEATPEAYGLTWDGSGTQYRGYTTAAQVQKSTAGSFDPATWGDIGIPSGSSPFPAVFLLSYTLAIKPA